MADKLRDDPFWRTRIINFVGDALRGYRKLTPVSGFEKKILERIEDIRAIDENIDDGLISLLKFAEGYVPPSTALRILMYWQDRDNLQIGYEIVYFAARDQIVLTEEEITQLINDLRKDPGLNIPFLITILDGTEKEDTGEIKIRPLLNLPTDFR